MARPPMDLYRAGELDEAVQELLALVKAKPSDSDLRFQLAEMSCIAGDLERADRQLDTVSNQDPQAAVGAALFRQLIRAELSRRECLYQGRVPEVIGEPTPAIQSRLRALAALRAEDHEAAAKAIDEVAEFSPQPPLSLNGKPAPVLRDLDDLLAPVLEVHTSTGKYFWIDWNQIVSLQIHPPRRPFDLLWRQASLSIESGPDGEVYLPAIYLEPQAGAVADASLRLGRSSDWTEVAPSIVRGRGQKVLLVGEDDLPFMELESIEREE